MEHLIPRPPNCRHLAVTRRPGEEVVIGDPHNPIGMVRVVGVSGAQVRIVFDFPADVEVWRAEIASDIRNGVPQVPR